MSMGYIYILKCSDGSYYTGSKKDLVRRLSEHQNALGSNYTKNKLPVKLLYYEEFPRIDDAFYREKQVQGWSRKKKKALIEERRRLGKNKSRNRIVFAVLQKICARICH